MTEQSAFNYIANGGDETARAKASEEYALGQLGGLLAEIERLRAALIQVRGFAKVMTQDNWADLRLHIERQCDVLEDKS